MSSSSSVVSPYRTQLCCSYGCLLFSALNAAVTSDSNLKNWCMQVAILPGASHHSLY